ncbi:MAG: signal transduction protein [Methylococcaceae bacterium]|nr:signal transduction protein [Methylococcaceae bacterium]
MKKNFLPDFCSLKVLLVVFLLTQLLAFLLALAADNSELGFLSLFALRSLLCLWIALSSIVLLCSLKHFLNACSNTFSGLFAFILIQLVCISMSYLAIEILPRYQLLIPFIDPEDRLAFYGRTLGISALVSIAFLRYLYVLYQWQQQVEAKAAAKLNALQARMRPHFLFNSLNSIAGLTRINPSLAESLVEDLAELIRASMKIDEALLVPLSEEFNLVRLYLAIEYQRLESRLNIRWDIEDLPQDAMIPALSLQPLVENAVYYGIEPSLEGGEIVIKGDYRFNRLFISISNPVSHEKTSRSGHNIALNNLKARLDGCFQQEAAVKIQTDDKHYQVTIEIPYENSNCR